MPQLTTTRDLAKKLGLSHSTVAMCLRNDPRVAAKTRERVLKCARENGYRPNPLVGALMAQVRGKRRQKDTGEVVAFLTASESADAWKNLFSASRQFEGASARGKQLGFSVQPFWLGNRGTRCRALDRVLTARGISGLLLAPLPIDYRTLELSWERYALIAMGYSFSQLAPHRVVHHNLKTMFTCYHQLRLLGHRRIGLVLQSEADERVLHLWSTAFLGAQRLYQGDLLEPCWIPTLTDPAPFLSWYKRRRPDAVIGIWNHEPLAWLRAAGIDVPGEVSFASLDLGEENIGRIAGVLQDNRNVGIAAMDVLASVLLQNEVGLPLIPRVTMIEDTWLDGPTVTRRDKTPRRRRITAS